MSNSQLTSEVNHWTLQRNNLSNVHGYKKSVPTMINIDYQFLLKNIWSIDILLLDEIITYSCLTIVTYFYQIYQK